MKKLTVREKYQHLYNRNLESLEQQAVVVANLAKTLNKKQLTIEKYNYTLTIKVK